MTVVTINGWHFFYMKLLGILNFTFTEGALARVQGCTVPLHFKMDCTANSYSQTTALLRQKGYTLDFAMAIGSILEFAVPLILKSYISYY